MIARRGIDYNEAKKVVLYWKH